jgi:hypothetical protein
MRTFRVGYGCPKALVAVTARANGKAAQANERAH